MIGTFIFKKFIDVKDYKMLYNESMNIDMLINALLGVIGRKEENEDEAIQEKTFPMTIKEKYPLDQE